jgi:hypothetical protein
MNTHHFITCSEVEEPFSLTFIVSAQHTNTLLRDGLAKMGIWPISGASEEMEQVDDALPVVGYTHLNFANKMDILDHGVSRFRLTKSSERQSRGLDIELLIDIKIEDIHPGVMRRFPWSSVHHNASTPLDEVMQELIRDPIVTKRSQDHCTSGDYLTIYTRSVAHPVSCTVIVSSIWVHLYFLYRLGNVTGLFWMMISFYYMTLLSR